MNELFRMLLISFLMTLILELPLSLLFGARKKGLLVVFLVNLLTNPLAVFLVYLSRFVFSPGVSLAFEFLIEALVIAVEAFVYCRLRPVVNMKHPILAAIILNLASYGIGKVISLLPWF